MSKYYNFSQDSGGDLSLSQGSLMVLDNVQLTDFHFMTGSSAILTENDLSQQFLTINTSHAHSSCTINLDMQHNIHGKVITDGVFSTFKFSPDGK